MGRGEAAGRGAGGRCKKKLFMRYCQARPHGGDPLARGEPALVAAICALRAARGRPYLRSGRLGRGAMAGGEAAPQWRRQRRRGEEQPRGAPGGARSLRIPRPRRRHLAIASPTGSAPAPPRASASGGRTLCVPIATGARGGRGRAPLLPRAGRSSPSCPGGGLPEPGGGGVGVRFS